MRTASSVTSTPAGPITIPSTQPPPLPPRNGVPLSARSVCLLSPLSSGFSLGCLLFSVIDTQWFPAFFAVVPKHPRVHPPLFEIQGLDTESPLIELASSLTFGVNMLTPFSIATLKSLLPCSMTNGLWGSISRTPPSRAPPRERPRTRCSYSVPAESRQVDVGSPSATCDRWNMTLPPPVARSADGPNTSSRDASHSLPDLSTLLRSSSVNPRPRRPGSCERSD